jgi:hypothetical protein
MVFIVEISRIHPNRAPVAITQSNYSADTLEEVIAALHGKMALDSWPASANGFRILDATDRRELYSFSD